jgi:hypothetical protein
MSDCDPEPIDRVQHGRLIHAELILDAYRRAAASGSDAPLREPRVADALMALRPGDICVESTDLLGDLHAWMTRRVADLARQHDPRVRRDCIAVRRLAFFHYYYLGPPTTYTEICTLSPTPATLVPDIVTLLHWWESTTGMSLSARPPVPRHIKHDQRIIDDLVPIAARSVGDNIRAAAVLVFDIRASKPVRAKPNLQRRDTIPEITGVRCIDHAVQSGARLLTRQWLIPKPFVVPEAELARLVEARHGLIVGDSGSGKTTLLRRIAAAVCNRERDCAVIVDFQDLAPRSLVGQPAVLAAQALAGRATVAQCEMCLASGTLVLLLDHMEWLNEDELIKLRSTITTQKNVYVAVPVCLAQSFAELPRFDMPRPSDDLIQSVIGMVDLPNTVKSLTMTPRGLEVAAKVLRKTSHIDAKVALTHLIDHAHLGMHRDDLLGQCHRLAMALAIKGRQVDAIFTIGDMEQMLGQEFAKICHLLLLSGLLDASGAGFRFTHPELVRTSMQEVWLLVALKLASKDECKRVVTAAQIISDGADHFVTMFVPQLVAAAEHGLLSPFPILDAILNLPLSTLRRHRDHMEGLIVRIDAALQHHIPDDSPRCAQIREAVFHLRRHAPPRMDRPIVETIAEISSLLTSAETLLDREQLWKAVHLADAAADAQSLDIICAFFDTHPECQADLLIGCLKADTVSGFNLFLLLVQRISFRATSSASYIAAAFPRWRDQFSLSLLQTYVQDSEIQSDDSARCFAHAIWRSLPVPAG